MTEQHSAFGIAAPAPVIEEQPTPRLELERIAAESLPGIEADLERWRAEAIALDRPAHRSERIAEYEACAAELRAILGEIRFGDRLVTVTP